MMNTEEYKRSLIIERLAKRKLDTFNGVSIHNMNCKQLMKELVLLKQEVGSIVQSWRQDQIH